MAGSHYTYIPFFPEDKDEDPEGWKKEAQELAKTLRLCVSCKNFHHFILTKREALWFHFACPVCGETIKLPRKRNYATNSYDKKKWE
jgi:predicted RNA-binding Zn-ribbon protein involved in translation (DUF1610 family)